MRRTLFAVLAVAAALVSPAAARADSPDLIEGGCSFVSDQTAQFVPINDRHTGVIADDSVTVDADALPTDATVTCWMQVNGAEVPGTRFSYSGHGVQTGANRMSYTAGVGDIVDECESVTFGDGTTQTICPPVENLTVPPDDVFWLLNFAFRHVDPVVCPQLAALAGSYPGGVTIAADGDVSTPDPFMLGLSPIYDCPPSV